MTDAIAAHYDLAQQLVHDGQWRVDPSVGLVYGKKGVAFRRRNSWGYIQIKFRQPGNWRQEVAVLAHRVIWEYVHGSLDPTLTINHMNGVKTDNRLPNLEAVTHLENVHHAIATGLTRFLRGTEQANAKLTEDQARQIYARAWSGETARVIACDYDVCAAVVQGIKQGWSWSSVTGHAKRR